MAASGKNVQSCKGQPNQASATAYAEQEFISVETGELMFGESEEELLHVALLSSVDFLYSGLSSCVPWFGPLLL